MSPALSIVADNDRLPPKRETAGQRVRRLQGEAKTAAQEHVRLLTDQLVEAQRTAAEIAEGGDAYGVGVRNAAQRLVNDFEVQIHTIQALQARQR